MSSNQAIGVFDSGVGGLTVAVEVFRQMPNERLVYFGDTGHVPYGARGREELVGFGDEIINFLLTKNVKAVIVACNTSSSVALDILQPRFNIPLIGVVKPGAEAAASTTVNKKVGVIATETTIKSGSYVKAIQAYDSEVEVFGQACPMFVPLVEAGQFDTPTTHQIAEGYLRPLVEAGIDTLVLGCTHYPYLSKVFHDILGDTVQLVDPAAYTVQKTKDILSEIELLSEAKAEQHEFFVSEDPDSFKLVGGRLVKDVIKKVNFISLE